jgi:hypothetical protein
VEGDDRDVEWLPPSARPPTWEQAPPPTGPPVHPPPPPQQPPVWQQTPSAPWPHAYGKAPSNQQAIWSLVLGIVGLVMFIFPAGFGLVFVFNLPPSIAAWVYGVKGKRRVDRGETHEHRGRAQAGMVLGIIGVALGVLAIVGWTLAIIFSQEVRDELSRSLKND